MSDNDTNTELACAGAVNEDRMQNATPMNTRITLIIVFLRTFFYPGSAPGLRTTIYDRIYNKILKWGRLEARP
jgi:hypothetical protein